jgi:hypothetical protein
VHLSQLLGKSIKDKLMPERAKFATHEEYIASTPSDVQTILLKVQALVEKALPEAQRSIGYGMPAYRDGKVFFYFAGFRNPLGRLSSAERRCRADCGTGALQEREGQSRFQIQGAHPVRAHWQGCGGATQGIHPEALIRVALRPTIRCGRRR